MIEAFHGMAEAGVAPVRSRSVSPEKEPWLLPAREPSPSTSDSAPAADRAAGSADAPIDGACEAPSTRARFRGCLLGLACGDALGAGVEFMGPEEIRAKHGTVRDMLGGGPFNWGVGDYTDDTQMALALAESLLAAPGVDLDDLARRWIAWLDGDPPDVGILTHDALRRIEALRRSGGDLLSAARECWEATGRHSAGNGGLMRTAPLAMRYAYTPGILAERAATVCALTHYDPRCRASCIVLCGVLADYLGAAHQGRPRVDRHAEAVRALSEATAEAVLDVHKLNREDVPSTGYTLATLQAGLWPVERGMSFEEGVVAVVNLGHDTDTCGAVAGAVLGARDGEAAIPARWLEVLKDRDRIRETADQLYELARADQPSA